MNKFISNIVSFSLKNRFFIFFITVVIIIGGIWSYINTPLDVFPDVTNTQIVIVSQWEGRSAEEVERYVTIPLEVALNPVQQKTSLRSVTMFGLSVITVNFDDGVQDFFARQQVMNLLSSADLPDDVSPEVQPPYGPTGEIYRYILKSSDKNSIDLLTYQNWVVDRQLKSVEGIADVYAFGGANRTYEITVDPMKLAKYEITPLDVYDAVSKSNINVGGDIIEKNGQAYVVRGIGLLTSISDIEHIVVDNINGTPILVKDLATVSPSYLPRLGQGGLDTNNDVVAVTVVMRKGENPAVVLKRLKDKVNFINSQILPSDIKIEPVYDRQVLMNYSTHTILHNLVEGILLVTLVVFLFMFDWRTTVIVGIIIPLSLLFAFICMRIKGMSANLLSMGAIDFGIIIDGAVVMVEGMFVVLAHKALEVGEEKFKKVAKLSIIRKNSSNLAKSIFFAKVIIIVSLFPIFSFQKVEGKMFSPLAWTLSFALLGALLFTLTLVPVLGSILLSKHVRERYNPIVAFFNYAVLKGYRFCATYKKAVITSTLILVVVVFYSFRYLGSEFLPSLNEGDLWVTTKLPMSVSLEESRMINDSIRIELLHFPEVEHVLSLIGRSNDGTDPNGFFFCQFEVNLKPKDQWSEHISYDQLIDKMTKKINAIPGIVLNFSQPIGDNVAEAVSGFKGNFGVKIFGYNLQQLEKYADTFYNIIGGIRGVKDLGIIRNLGQPEFSIILHEDRMATYGITDADANSVIEMAIGGKSASTFYDREKKFPIRIRYPVEYRNSEAVIANLLVPTIHNVKIPLKEIADIKTISSPAFIYRDDNNRYIAIKFSIRGRDMGSTIAEAQRKTSQLVHLPKGTHTVWTGEFENQVRAQRKLTQIVPVVIVIIFVILFITFGNVRDAGLVILNVPFAIAGGILALHITGTVFSISAGIGFIALFGICIQNAVILITKFKQNIFVKMPLHSAIEEGIKARVRPVVMTALMAAIGLLPAAVSRGIGSETQRPLAIVVIGGLLADTLLSLLIFSNIVHIAYAYKLREKREKRLNRKKQNGLD